MPYRVLFMTDHHIPDHDKRANKAVLAYLRRHEWDEVILGGDLLDFGFLSKFDKHLLGRIEGKTFTKQYNQGKEYLDQLREAVGESCKIVMLQGNHEYRVNRFLDSMPQFKGLVEVPIGLELEKRKIEWIPCWETSKARYRIGRLKFVHGSYHNIHHAAKHSSTYRGCIMYGHMHSPQCFVQPLHDPGDYCMAQAVGCLCKYDPHYKNGKPSNWCQGFAVVYFLPNGNFNHYVVNIRGGKFISPEGEIWGPKGRVFE